MESHCDKKSCDTLVYSNEDRGANLKKGPQLTWAENDELKEGLEELEETVTVIRNFSEVFFISLEINTKILKSKQDKHDV